eukprot:TRINITY_DN2983_c0_g1::TRINITY_DN2983_c0_g1_i1::g.4235::m.4235 TRINITY_DN2983_c0_g1::TRINITY_DN2983_c0_g1_i1::g.4235  ORF type:complete len:285 (+),score=-10.98,sp/Q0V9K2/ABHDB_XENTR/31.17/1e-27,Abhydrolase_6/PF12697.2/2e-34,Abhydrolase_1/PF00561.15/7.8e-13,Abhydrolase_5/PF12695.2/3.3e-12,PGAP1/PF07819.8/4.3e-07,Thioesterase/PF00975.15/0.0005,FSH1/PF03959.8/2.6,FSH1/PF03959.8/1.5,DUF3089/PF11288.3/0.016,DUF3141/PF11339.3/0.027,Esterase/PF00756.15/0.05,DUF915/PF06028.6/16,DUF915/PF06028.6/1.9,Chlo
MVSLAFRKLSLLPQGKPSMNLNILLLHGLLSTNRTFDTLVRSLTAQYTRASNCDQKYPALQLYLPDLRNHGNSPHTSSHTLFDMVDDVNKFISDHQIEKPILIGHSQGGRVAMLLALMNPNISGGLRGLVSLDASPASYNHNHQHIFAAMEALRPHFKKTTSRRELDHILQETLPSLPDRAYVLQNLVVDEYGAKWSANIETLAEQEHHIHEWPQLSFPPCTLPSLFIGGELSSRLTNPEFLQAMTTCFPSARLEMIPKVGHFVHIAAPTITAQYLFDFVSQFR